MLLTLLLFSLSSSSFGADVTLPSANDFTDFVDKVNSGSNYSGTTVCLDSDITLTESTDPIGNGTYYFLGVFDGQGHTIGNLTMDSSSEYTGLFGYSTGLTIRNVVLDSSCSITSAYSNSGHAFIGGIIGECYASSGGCNIENSVNMAGVTFSGTISGSYYSLFIGGVVGCLYSWGHNAYVKNCVNYGSVTDSGTVNDICFAYLSGVVGSSSGSSSFKYIQNCLSYGTITHNGTSPNLIIGGIVGYGAYYTYIENCVSSGKISTQTTASKDNRVGSIVGKVNSDIHINYCYYTSDVNASSINGYGIPSSTTGTLDTPTDVNFDLVSKLNSNATSCNWSKWLLNANNATVTFKMSDDKELSFSTQIILIPDPVKKGNSFLFWCRDAEYAEKFDPSTEQISKNITLYAAWVNNTVIFDANGGNVSVVSKNVTFNEKYGDLPEPDRTGYIFIGWFDEKNENVTSEKIVTTAYNHTLRAKWTPNNYTVTFNVSGGNDLSEDEATKIVTFDEEYGKLPEPTRTGYMFVGWFNESNELITNETIVTTPSNHTLYARWEEATNQVKIVFNKKDLTKEEVKNIIEKYTKADFEITKFEKSSESDEINVIIKFVDKKDAKEFVETINKLGSGDDVKEVKFVFGYESFSLLIYPLSFLNAFFL